MSSCITESRTSGNYTMSPISETPLSTIVSEKWKNVFFIQDENEPEIRKWTPEQEDSIIEQINNAQPGEIRDDIFIDTTCNNLLHWAVWMNSPRVITALLDKGLNINYPVQNYQFNSNNSTIELEPTYNTPLHLALSMYDQNHSMLETVKALLDYPTHLLSVPLEINHVSTDPSDPNPLEFFLYYSCDMVQNGLDALPIIQLLVERGASCRQTETIESAKNSLLELENQELAGPIVQYLDTLLESQSSQET